MTDLGPDQITTPHDKLQRVALLPEGFRFGEVVDRTTAGGLLPRAVEAEELPPTPLGPLEKFAGVFTGKGFNTIFRPHHSPDDTNVLELNLTDETLSFFNVLPRVPNRGMVQDDINLAGVAYLQSINDITLPAPAPVGIHLEPGLWMVVPKTTDPNLAPTIVRMASIPHGTTIVAQGNAPTDNPGPPSFDMIDITPTKISGGGKVKKFDSQTADTRGTSRIPEALSPFIEAETITQGMLDNPNSLLQKHIDGQTITSTTTLFVSTEPAAPLFGGGVANIPFLLGSPKPPTNETDTKPNAETVSMQATFWIETVEHTIVVPPSGPGDVLTLSPETNAPGMPGPTFQVSPLTWVTEPQRMSVTSTQIQYSQEVFLNFNGLSWPHVSVATLVPNDPIPVPWT